METRVSLKYPVNDCRFIFDMRFKLRLLLTRGSNSLNLSSTKKSFVEKKENNYDKDGNFKTN